MIFVKKITRPQVWKQEFTQKTRNISQFVTLANLRQKSVNALKWPNPRQKSVKVAHKFTQYV